jgi:hypothetical protein
MIWSVMKFSSLLSFQFHFNFNVLHLIDILWLLLLLFYDIRTKLELMREKLCRASHGPTFREPQHINWKHNFKIIMDSVEDYARRLIKREVDQDPELESLSDWVYSTRSDSQTQKLC